MRFSAVEGTTVSGASIGGVCDGCHWNIIAVAQKSQIVELVWSPHSSNCLAFCEPHRSFVWVVVADAPEDVAKLSQCRCVDGLGDGCLSVRWCEDEKADWALVEDHLVASEDTGG